MGIDYSVNATSNYVNLIIKLFLNFKSPTKIRLVILLILMLFVSLTEAVSISAILPFFKLLFDPDKFFETKLYIELAKIFHLKTNRNDFVAIATFVFVIIVIVVGILRLLLIWMSNSFISKCGAEISNKIFYNIISQNYSYHINTNSSEVINTIINNVNGVVNWVITPLLNLVNNLIILILVSVVLIYIEPIISIIMFLGFGSFYTILSGITRKKILENAEYINIEHKKTIKILQESIGGIRDIILNRSHDYYRYLYEKSDTKLRHSTAINNFIGSFPRPAIEAVGISLLSITAYYYLNRGGSDINSYIPVLGVIALGAQRLIPSLQQIYSSISSITSGKCALVDTVNLLYLNNLEDEVSYNNKTIRFERLVELKNIYYKYTEGSDFVVNNLNIEIPFGSRIGLVGKTGSGKSTTLDVFMGLLDATSGHLIVDNKIVDKENIKDWQYKISHVPQDIYIIDATFKENIAFGIPIKLIDHERVRKAASLADINSFIESTQNGYNTKLGERGVKLSGGERQRIGIARALYLDKKIIILDEGTSSLDNITEKNIMASIASMGSDITFIIVAHRITTVEMCDCIYVFQNGKIISKGRYTDLIGSCNEFNELVAPST